jgi:uncharacterized short protein YbdD (DUF466 family)
MRELPRAARARAGLAVAAATKRPLKEKLMPAMETLRDALRRTTSALWQWLRGAAGDQAYESYLLHAEKIPGRPLTAKEFYQDQLQRKYSRPNRCC